MCSNNSIVKVKLTRSTTTKQSNSFHHLGYWMWWGNTSVTSTIHSCPAQLCNTVGIKFRGTPTIYKYRMMYNKQMLDNSSFRHRPKTRCVNRGWKVTSRRRQAMSCDDEIKDRTKWAKKSNVIASFSFVAFSWWMNFVGHKIYNQNR